MPNNDKEREEQIKNEVGADLFAEFDTTEIIGDIDFSVAEKRDKNDELKLFDDRKEYFLWAEAKAGTKCDITESFVQLILTIGKQREYEHRLPPVFLGAFDEEKIAFVRYEAVADIFYRNDFNWKVTPSNHHSKEFLQMLNLVGADIDTNKITFYYVKDNKELTRFIRDNFKFDLDGVNKVQITRHNFTYVYQRWLIEVKPSIDFPWEAAKKENILDVDFYLADLLSKDDITETDILYVLLEKEHYLYGLTRTILNSKLSFTVEFNDNQAAYKEFWKRYERPPKNVFWDYILERRDLLMPKDVRERKGAFFTPPRWVNLSQQYIAAVLGNDWQKEYYVWDCCAGTGNLLAGLTETSRLFASTLDIQDVKVMKQRIKARKLKLGDNHVFQFDFLNDSFDKLPQSLRDIINDEERRKKLVIYINPPYAEAGNQKSTKGNGVAKTNVAVKHLTYTKYLPEIGLAGRELFAQFLIRIYKEIPSCVIANFSTLKVLSGQNFFKFRNVFKPKLSSLFIVPAYTFDNVKGHFPIGFYIWRTDDENKHDFKSIEAEVYNSKGELVGTKNYCSYDGVKSINDWMISTRNRPDEKRIGWLSARSHDVAHINFIFIANDTRKIPHPRGTWITDKNIIEAAVYLAVCQVTEQTWLNNKDQFLAPNDSWQDDVEFQTDCLAYTLLHGQNRITVADGPNHWIPFSEKEVGITSVYDSRFMIDFINDFLRGKIRYGSGQAGLFADDAAAQPADPADFSVEARAVLAAGLKLWQYYHKKPGANINASFYDIRLFFQGTDEKGNMNRTSGDRQYNEILAELSSARNTLAEKIQRGVYRYGFLLA